MTAVCIRAEVGVDHFPLAECEADSMLVWVEMMVAPKEAVQLTATRGDSKPSSVIGLCISNGRANLPALAGLTSIDTSETRCV
jgi:hypothetical protein